MKTVDRPAPTYELIHDETGRVINVFDGAPPYIAGQVFDTDSCFVWCEKAEVISVIQKKRGRPYHVRIRYFSGGRAARAAVR